MLHDMKDASSPVKLVILLQCLQHTDSLVTQSASTDNATYNNKKVYECHTGVAGQSSCPFPPTPKPTLHQQSLPTPYLQLFPSHASRFAQINRRLNISQITRNTCSSQFSLCHRQYLLNKLLLWFFCAAYFVDNIFTTYCHLTSLYLAVNVVRINGA